MNAFIQETKAHAETLKAFKDEVYGLNKKLCDSLQQTIGSWIKRVSFVLIP